MTIEELDDPALVAKYCEAAEYWVHAPCTISEAMEWLMAKGFEERAFMQQNLGNSDNPADDVTYLLWLAAGRSVVMQYCAYRAGVGFMTEDYHTVTEFALSQAVSSGVLPV